MKHALTVALLTGLGAATLIGCGGNRASTERVEQTISGNVNPYLWRASLDTLSHLPVMTADPFGGVITYDWKSYPDLPDERIKATVYILDSRLRADGISVRVFRQTRVNGTWQDAAVSDATTVQLENEILNRARRLRVAEIE